MLLSPIKVSSLQELLDLPHKGDRCILLPDVDFVTVWNARYNKTLHLFTPFVQHCNEIQCRNTSHFFPPYAMATLVDLPEKSISDMTDDELEDRLLDLRKNRRVQMTNNKTVRKLSPKKLSKSATISGDNLLTLIGDLSDEELKILKAKLG